MTVKELINMLKVMPEDAKVKIVIAGGEYNLDNDDFTADFIDGIVELH